jgi:hypothetical protein
MQQNLHTYAAKFTYVCSKTYIRMKIDFRMYVTKDIVTQ